jgi:FtsZ-interacting cell division protein ZipA
MNIKKKVLVIVIAFFAIVGILFAVLMSNKEKLSSMLESIDHKMTSSEDILHIPDI